MKVNSESEEKFKDLCTRNGMKKEVAEFMAQDNWRDTLAAVVDPTKGDSSERLDVKKLMAEQPAASKTRSGAPSMQIPADDDWLTQKPSGDDDALSQFIGKGEKVTETAEAFGEAMENQLQGKDDFMNEMKNFLGVKEEGPAKEVAAVQDSYEDKFKDLCTRKGMKNEVAEFMAQDNWRETLAAVVDPTKGDSSERPDIKKLLKEQPAASKK
jgi:hypothetical protein